MLKKAPTNRMLKQLLTAWNEYPRTYKMFIRSKIYKNLAKDWTEDQRIIADYVLECSSTAARPTKMVKCKKQITSADIQNIVNYVADQNEYYHKQQQKERKKVDN